MQSLQYKNSKTLLFIAVALSIAIIFFDQSSIGVLLPSIKNQFHVSNLTLSWILNAYILSLSTLILVNGRAIDFLGAKTMFLLGAILFSISSFLCGVSATGTLLIIGRVCQGIGASMLIPATLVLINTKFEASERGRVYGAAVTVGAVFFAAGPFLGGFFAEFFSWRYVFFFSIPINLISLVIVLLFIEADAKPKIFSKFDIKGSITFVISITTLVIALMQAPYLSLGIFVFIFCIGVCFFILFLFFEKSNERPLLPLKLFKIRNFWVGNIILFSIQISVISTVFWVVWLQEVLHYSPLKAGVAILPGFIPSLFLSRLAGTWLDFKGCRLPICLGTALIFIGVLGISIFAILQSYFLIFFAMLLYGIGAAITIPNMTTVILSSVSLEYKGVAAGVLNTMRQVGGCFGIAAISTFSTIFYHIASKQYHDPVKLQTYAFSLGIGLAALFAGVAWYVSYRFVSEN